MGDFNDFFSTFLFIERLERLPRSGWLVAGVRSVESIAAHSYGVAMVAMWLGDKLKEEGSIIDSEKLLRMALLHDVGEAITTDIPGPVKKTIEGMYNAETKAGVEVLKNAPKGWIVAMQDYENRECIESRLVKVSDKIQMMLMAAQYERSTALDLSEFFDEIETNFPYANEIMTEIRAQRD